MSDAIHIACTKKLKEDLKKDALQKSFFIEDYEIIETASAINKSILPYLNNPSYTYIFTSSKAVQYFIEYNKDSLSSITNSCFAISGATAESIQNTSLKLVDTAPDAASLAEKIIQKQHKKLVHFTSADHRKELYDILERNQISCETCIVYTKLISPKRFQEHEAVLFFSPSQVDAYVSSNTISKSTPVFCIGNTTANHAEIKGFKKILISPEPTQESIIKEVYKYFKRNT